MVTYKPLVRATHAQRLERWLGKEYVEQISRSMANWYGPPISIANLPGRVYATKGGDFVGPIRGGYFANLKDFTEQRCRRILRNATRVRGGSLHAGFSSLSDLISEATTGGKSQILQWSKTSVTGVTGRGTSLWNQGAFPVAGAAGGTTGTGVARSRTTQGALAQADAGAGDTLHITNVTSRADVGTLLLLMYDRLWDMTHTMTVDPRSCDAANPPTRYQTAALAPGNFFSGEVTTALPAAAPTITLNYVDQDGVNTAGPAFSTVSSSAALQTIPFSAPNWFYPLAAGDTGLRSLQNSASAIDLSAAMASGVVTWFIGHPLCMIPSPTAGVPVVVDGINSAFNLQRIYDDACVAFLEPSRGTTTAATWWGTVILVSG